MNVQDLLRQRIQQGSLPDVQADQALCSSKNVQPSTAGSVNLYAQVKGRAWSQPQEQEAQSAQAARYQAVLQRLRELASSLPPKQLERREVERWRDPMVPGGPRVPADYPDAQAWPSDDLPPGSLHDERTWQEARIDEHGRRCAVVEVLSERGSFLMQLPHEQDASTDEQKVGALFGQAFDGCIVVLPKARPRFAGAIEPCKHRQGSQEFWVIRPRRDYLDASKSRSYLVGARWQAESHLPYTEPETQAEPDPAERPGLPHA